MTEKTSHSEKFAELFEQSVSKLDLRPGSIITAKVVEITPENVLVHAGLKSESYIPIAEFKDKEGNIEVAKESFYLTNSIWYIIIQKIFVFTLIITCHRYG